MSDEFLKAIIPEWDDLSREQQQKHREQLDQMLDGELNPVRASVSQEPKSCVKKTLI